MCASVSSPSAGGADVRLLAGVETGVDEEAVLEVVDAEFGRLLVGDGAEMTGDLQSVRVRCVDGGLQFGARDVHVRLERGDALVDPVFDGLARVVGAW